MTVGNTKGFTLIEVMMTLVIFSFVILGFSAATTGVIRLNEVSSNYTIAATLTQDMFETLKARSVAGMAIDSGTDASRPGFTRSWAVTPSALNPGLIRVDVTVGWNDYEPRQITFSSIIND